MHCGMFFRRLSVRFLPTILLFSAAFAQPSVELQQAFLDLKHDGVVMNVSAHPDDEDGATLSYYRMKHGVKTYSLLFTRGEGGQNEIGPELYEELGVLRTSETLEAGKILGAEVYFLNFEDFGYSKTATETFRKWGGAQEVLRRLVYLIRKLKPDVIFTNHNTIGGHGHHQAVGITAIAAFDAAADSTMFPEQLHLNGLSVWQPRKLFMRNFGSTDQTADAVNQIGETDSARGISYLEIAGKALAQHKTQGMDIVALRRFTRGLSLYRLMRANSVYPRDTTSFFGGIDLWNDPGLASLKDVRSRLSRLSPGISRDSLLDISSSVFLLAGRANALSPLANRVLRQWQEELGELVSRTCGISISWTFNDTVVVPTQKVKTVLELQSDDCPLGDVKLSFDFPQGWAVNEGEKVIGGRRNAVVRHYDVIIGDHVIPTLPKAVAQYNGIENGQNLSARAWIFVDGRRTLFTVRPSFEIAPHQMLEVTPAVARFSSSDHKSGKKFKFRLTNLAPRKVAGRIVVQMPPGWLSETAAYVIPGEDSSTTGELLVKPPADVQPGEYLLRFRSEYARADVRVKVFDVHVDRAIKLGIVTSYDNTLEAAASDLGMPYELLGPGSLEGDLSRFTTILVDIRAYLAREDLKKHNNRLLEYVRNGGHVIVMYQKDQDWKPEYAPYPFRITRRRITVEDAPVTVLAPDHPLFNVPNKITPWDWDGWVQERGVYFPGDVADEYLHLISSHDPDETPLTTGYLIAGYGKGSYIYTSYVWYRQLKELNAGALRCFANMIAYPRYRSRP